MEDYRFKLQKYTPGSKITCPSCGGKRCTVRYIDTEGKIKFPDDVCLCDHANSCGHHYPPRQYFADHPELKDEYFKESKDYHIPNVGTSSVPSSHSLSDSHAYSHLLVCHLRSSTLPCFPLLWDATTSILSSPFLLQSLALRKPSVSSDSIMWAPPSVGAEQRYSGEQTSMVIFVLVRLWDIILRQVIVSRNHSTMSTGFIPCLSYRTSI